MSEKQAKKQLPQWLEKFREIPNAVIRDGKLFIRVAYTDQVGKKKSFEQIVGEPAKNNFSELKESAEDVRRELRQTIKQKKAGLFDKIDRAKVSINLADFLDIWFENASPTLATRTRDDYKNVIDRYIRKSIGQVLLFRLKTEHIQDLINELNKKGIARQAKYVRQVLSVALNYAIEFKYYDFANPCKSVKLPKKQHAEIVAFDKAQAKKFLDVCRTFGASGLMFEFALITGMRPEEYLALKWSDIDFENFSAQVRRKVVLGKADEPIFEETKTKSSRRLVDFDESLSKRLELHQAEQKLHIAKFQKYKNLKYQNFNLVFPSNTGTPFELGNLSRRHFNPVLRKAGLAKTGASLYSLRHTCASLLLAAGEHPKVVQERLGHSSIVITLDTYSHLIPTMQRGATQKLGELLA